MRGPGATGSRTIPRLVPTQASIARDRSLARGREAYAVDQLFHFVFGAADHGDRERVPMREKSQRGLPHDAGSNIFVKVTANQVLIPESKFVRLLVGGEALCFRDFGQRAKILR